MSNNSSFGYKKIFGIVLPSWVSEKMLKSVVLAFLTVVVMFFVLILVINPRLDDLKGSEVKLNSSKQSMESLQKITDSIQKMSQDIDLKSGQTVLKAMPMDYSPENIIYVLRQLASDTGVSIISYSLPSGVIIDDKPQAGTKGEILSVRPYVVNVTVSAPVEVLLKFVSKVESTVPYGLVSDLNLQEVSKFSKSQLSKNLQISLELKYFQSFLNPFSNNEISVLSQTDLDFLTKISRYNDVFIPENPEINTGSSSGVLF